MCNKGWKMHRYNPANVSIKTFEMPHEPDRFSPRGGPNTGDHVDILGRQSLNDLILRVAAGRGEGIEENVVSNIGTYAERVKVFEEEEYLAKKKKEEEKEKGKEKGTLNKLEKKAEEVLEKLEKVARDEL